MERLGTDVDDGDQERKGGHGRRRPPRTPLANSGQEYQMLRRPHHLPPGGAGKPKPSEECKGNKSLEDIVMNSTLSVDAAEFIPKGFSVDQNVQQPGRLPKHTVQDRLQRARASSNHQVPQPQQYNYSKPYPQEHLPQDNYSHGMHHVTGNQDYMQYDGAAGDYRHQDPNSTEPLDYNGTTQQLLNVIHLLILTPGRFSSVVPAVMKSIRPYLEFPNQFREFIAIIIQQSVNEVNFRYSGARLCTSFESSISMHEQGAFRDILYSLCKEETESQAAQWQQKQEHTEEEQRKCHGLILFLAELVTQMQDTPSCGLGKHLIKLITTVLKNPAPNSVKQICQALKLAGQTLEKDKGGNREDMENMMRALTQLVTESRVDSHVGRMVNSVHELRNGNWGQGTPTVNSTPVEVVPGAETGGEFLPDGPVLYGPDGQILSPEENEFLEDVAETAVPAEEPGMGGHGDFEPWISEEEDEIDAAFEEFLKLIPNKVVPKAQH